MVQNDTPTATPLSAPTVVQVSALELIQKAFPNRAGYTRRINAVFKTYYRVNFHELDNAFQVGDSYFVNVSDNHVETMN